jgi:uncharacterized protein YecE (DUF72 family)
MIRVGIGGWTYPPWRGTFYPEGLAHARELEYASRRLTSIEINATFYRLQSASTFGRWHDATPGDFVFALKAPRFVTQRKVLAGAGEAIERFIASGIVELGPKLGPINWQFAPTRRFDEIDCAAFLQLLPRRCAGVSLRHVLEVRHPSFVCREFVDLARAHDVGIVAADSADHPLIADASGRCVYLRLMRSSPRVRTGYAACDLDRWAGHVRSWARGASPRDLPRLAPGTRKARDVFAFFIAGAKERAPAAALALIERL